MGLLHRLSIPSLRKGRALTAIWFLQRGSSQRPQARSAMAFFKRVMDHLLNQVLVDGLANSRWFQRFAVWSHGAMKELSEKGKDGAAVLDTHVAQWSKVAQEAGAKFRQDVAEEMKKVQEQIKQQQDAASRIKK